MLWVNVNWISFWLLDRQWKWKDSDRDAAQRKEALSDSRHWSDDSTHHAREPFHASSTSAAGNSADRGGRTDSFREVSPWPGTVSHRSLPIIQDTHLHEWLANLCEGDCQCSARHVWKIFPVWRSVPLPSDLLWIHFTDEEQRILTRCDTFPDRPTNKKKKNKPYLHKTLTSIYPHLDQFAVILDDREDIWSESIEVRFYL